VYGTIILRTVIMAVLVTVTDAVIALPFAFFIAKIASRRSRQAVSRARLPAAVGELPRPGVRVDQHSLEPRRIAKY